MAGGRDHHRRLRPTLGPDASRDRYRHPPVARRASGRERDGDGAGWLTGYEGYGNVVTVDEGGGYSVLYAHLSSSHVVPGQWLAVGESIGEAGCTGSCTGTHLHFELRLNGVPIDPAPFLG